MSLDVTSTAFDDGTPVPQRYTCDGADVSPPLEWAGVPEGARSLALLVDDPDAPAGTWIHWMLYELDPERTELPEGVLPGPDVLDGAHQGENDFGDVGYGGPCPPPGSPHRYRFRLYALDASPGLAAGATVDQLEGAMEGHVLAQGRLTGTYAR